MGVPPLCHPLVVAQFSDQHPSRGGEEVPLPWFSQKPPGSRDSVLVALFVDQWLYEP
jgi:hypothetical protein